MAERQPLTKGQVAGIIRVEQHDKAGLLDNRRRIGPTEGWDNSFARGVLTGYAEYRGYVTGLLQGSGQIGHDFANRLRRMDVDDFEAAAGTLLDQATKPLSNYEKMSPDERERRREDFVNNPAY